MMDAASRRGGTRGAARAKEEEMGGLIEAILSQIMLCGKKGVKRSGFERKCRFWKEILGGKETLAKKGGRMG